jgi:hypothetical protein
LRKLLSFSVLALSLTFGTSTPASANPGQVLAPPPATDEVSPGKACQHATLGKNRNFDSNHATGVNGNGTPPMCPDDGGGS